MTLPAEWVHLLEELAAQAGDLQGQFFRSTELRYSHPDDAISGAGTKASGGRFVPAGTNAVYVSLDEETAFREATARKARLGGTSQIALKDYPRVTHVVSIWLQRHVDLRRLATTTKGREILAGCSRVDLAASQATGQFLFRRGIQGVIFPSVVCAGANLVVSRDVEPLALIEVLNRNEIIDAIRKLAHRR